MNNINIVAVPNGFFTLEEALQVPGIPQALLFLQKDKKLSKKEKLKTFLSFYQTADTLAQLKIQGFKYEEVDENHVAELSFTAIAETFDDVMETFSDEDRAKLHGFFQIKN